MTRKDLSCSMLSEILLKIFAGLLFLQTGFATDIEILNQLKDTSLVYDVLLPELCCHARYEGYTQVIWYKDGVVVKNSSANLFGHMLSLGSLLAKPFFNPLKLQGYYWCETDLNSTESPPNKYLFKVANVHTYVAKIVAKNDQLPNDTMNNEEKLLEKRLIYEDELQHILFSFLPQPSAFVTDVQETSKGLVVKFFVYVLETFLSRVSSSSKLMEDEEKLNSVLYQLQYQQEWDEMYSEHVSQWKKHLGISLMDMEIYSTVACYSHPSLFPNQKKGVTWPFSEIGEIVVPKEGCSAENGLAVTRRCIGSFTEGAKWGPIKGVCEVEPGQMTLDLMALTNKLSKQDPASTVRELEILTDNPKDLKIIDLHYVSTALQFTSKTQLTQSDIESIFTIVNNILHVNKSNMEAAKSTLGLSSRIISAVENAVKLSSADFEDTTVSKSEIIMKTKDTKVENNMVIGAAVLSSPKASSRMNTTPVFLKNGSHIPPSHSFAGFVLPTELILKRLAMLSHPCKLKTIFFHDWTLFPSLKSTIHHPIAEIIPSPVIYVGISGGPAWNLSKPVRIFFKTDFDKDVESPICVYFDKNLNDGFGGWATEGCYFAGLKEGFHMCHCHHLSTYSIILSQKPGYTSGKIGVSIYTGCGISIFALALIILLFAATKIWRSNVDHYIFFFLGLGLLCSFIFLLLHGIKSSWRPGCMLLSVLFYYFLQASFCWSLILSISHYLILARNSDACDMPNFIIRSAIFAWDLPLLIVGLIWVVKGSEYYDHKICWLTMTEISNIVCYPVLIILLLTLCFHMLTTYAVTCRFKKQLDFFGKEQKETLVKFRISFSIFIFFSLSWIFGYLSLHHQQMEFKVLFSVSAIITSIYILLFFVFNDASARQLLLKEPKGRSSKPASASTDAIACEVKTYDAT